MNEQEKARKELYDKFKKWANENFTVSYSGATGMSVPSVEGLLTRIVLYVLRKEEDVRREERKKLLNRIRNMYKETGNCINYETLVFIKGLAKEFGVEVEE